MGPSLSPIEGKYEILAKLKEGGMGAIYKVRHLLLDEVRVVKVLRPQFEGDLELKERFAREARSAIKLRHPNVVQIFDFSMDDSGAGLIVMEFIEGGDLGRLVQPGSLVSVPLVLEIARQSLKALGFLHQHGFVHRDVSPDNLMLSLDHDQRPVVKLIDLGIAKRHDTSEQLTVSGSFLGKFRYASPEHFGSRGPGGIDGRSDLYTFGLVFYELLTGRYPLAGEGTSQLIAAHLFKEPLDFEVTDPAGRVPPVLQAMVMRSLAKAPEDRFEDAATWIAEIEQLQRSWPFGPAELEEARALVAAQKGAAQVRSDSRFDVEKTPGGSIAPTEEVTRISSSIEARDLTADQVRGLLAEAESRLDRGEDEGVITLLRRAQQMAEPVLHREPELRTALSSALVRIHRKIRQRPPTHPSVVVPPPPPPPAPALAAPAAPDPVKATTTTSLGGGLLGTLAEIEKLRIEGDVLGAWQMLKQALEQFGEVPSLVELRKGLAEDLLETSRND